MKDLLKIEIASDNFKYTTMRCWVFISYQNKVIFPNNNNVHLKIPGLELVQSSMQIICIIIPM